MILGWLFHQRDPPQGWVDAEYGAWERSPDGQEDGLYVLLCTKIPSRMKSSMKYRVSKKKRHNVFTDITPSNQSNTMILIGNLDLGYLIDNLLTTPTPRSCRFLITFSWIM